MKKFLFIIISIWAFFSCYDTQNNTGTVSLQMHIQGKEHSLTRIHESVPTGIEMITVGVTGLVEPVSVNMDTLELSIEVPAGKDREFVTKAFDADNTLTYRGSAVADITAGKETIIAVTMEPVDPVDTIDPGDTESPIIIEFIATSATKSAGTVYIKLSATDNTAVTGWMITESSVAPAVNDSNWLADAPTTAQLSIGNGTKILYAWAKDAAGNISAAKTLPVERLAVGAEAWNATITNDPQYQNRARAVAVDSKGNVYVAGTVYSQTTNNDWVIKKYDINGTDISWTINTFDNANSDDVAYGMAIDAEDNTYVVGSTYIAQNQSRYWLVRKFNGAGVQQWQYISNSDVTNSSGTEEARAVAVHRTTGDIYVVGYLYYPDMAEDWWIKKFNKDGVEYTSVQGWNKHFVHSQPDVAQAVAVDQNSGDVYVAGYYSVYDQAQHRNWQIKKFTSAGNEYATGDGWDKSFTSGGSNNDEARSIAIDKQGNVYIAGIGYNLASLRPASQTDWWVMKFNSSGTSLWTNDIKYDNSNYSDEANAIAVDAQDNVFVAGSFSNAAGNKAAHIRLYTAAGDFQWEVTGQPINLESWNALALFYGNIVAAGATSADGNGYDWWLKNYVY